MLLPIKIAIVSEHLDGLHFANPRVARRHKAQFDLTFVLRRPTKNECVEILALCGVSHIAPIEWRLDDKLWNLVDNAFAK